MKGFTLLWSKMLDSSIWVCESKETKLLWVTMMMMRDMDGKIFASKVGLAQRAGLTLEECEESLKVLLSPDANDTSKVEEGRRLRGIPGGWELVNFDTYRFTTEAKRALWREEKAKQRERERKEALAAFQFKSKPLDGEAAYVSGVEEGTVREDAEEAREDGVVI